MKHGITRATVVLLASGPSLHADGGQSETDEVFWRGVTLRLKGALPNTHPKLGDEPVFCLGRRPEADRGGGDATGKWRADVFGYSALFDPHAQHTQRHPTPTTDSAPLCLNPQPGKPA